MKALVCDSSLKVTELPQPTPADTDVLIRVQTAGICNTDIEITRGYIPGFTGILGHEFIGTVEKAADPALVGKRVSAEINLNCGHCSFCTDGLGRHCPSRSVIGIVNRAGAMAEYIVVPQKNVWVIPESIPNDRAIFIEPLAAALEILDQVEISPSHQTLVIGDGKLGLLIALVLSAQKGRVSLMGKHHDKMAFLKNTIVHCVTPDTINDAPYDVIVEASGNCDAFRFALSRIRPRGTIVLKSTYAGEFSFNPSDIVVNEITLIGSRCGRFDAALGFMTQHPFPLEQLISARFPLADGVKAFEYSQKKGVLKVLLDC